MSRQELDQVEQLLRQNAAQLRDETAARCLTSSVLQAPPGMSSEAAARAGADHIHELVLVVAALYPSETTLRQQYEWASTGILDRYHVDYDQLAALLQVYFEVARDVLGADLLPVLDSLEMFMKRVLTDVFLGPADS